MTLSPRIHLLVLGTDPQSKKGGIAFAIPAFLVALDSVGLTYDFIPTHFAGTINGKWLPWLKSIILARYVVKGAKSRGDQPIAYIHMGGGIVSCIRKNILARLLSKLSVPVIIQIHGPGTETYYNSNIKRYMFNMWCLAPASAVAVLTPWCASLVARNKLHNLVHVVPNALNDNLAEAANRQRILQPADKCKTILAMSRLVKGKGFNLIVDALPYLKPGIIVEIAGTGPLQSILKKRISQLGQTDKVRFLGWINDEEKDAAFSRADIFCLPSQFDSFGMGYIEAMAHGLPIVGLKYGPIPDVVPDGKCGILIDKPDPVMLAEAVTKLLALDSAQRYAMEKTAKCWVKETFGSDIVGHKIKSICEAVL